MPKANYTSMFKGQTEDYSTIFYNGGLLKQLQNGKLYIEYNKMFSPSTILISRPESFLTNYIKYVYCSYTKDILLLS